VAVAVMVTVMDIVSGSTNDCPGDVNLALGKHVGYNQAVGLHEVLHEVDNDYWYDQGATDGVYGKAYENCVVTPTPSPDIESPFVYIDLEAVYEITKVAIGTAQKNTLAVGGCMEIVVSDNVLDSVSSFQSANGAKHCATVPAEGFSEKWAVDEFACEQPVTGRYVGFIQWGTNTVLHFCEAEVYCSDTELTPTATDDICESGTDIAPTEEPTVPSPDSYHWIAAGDGYTDDWYKVGVRNAECVADSDVSVSEGPSCCGYDIAVSCCIDNGVAKRKFGEDDDPKCYQAKTYNEAKAICEGETDNEGNNYRLCTLKEMLKRKTKGAGCNHDYRYNWVSDECNICESTDMMARHSTDISGGNVAENDLTPMIVGVAIGAVVIALITTIIVLLTKRKRTDLEIKTGNGQHVNTEHVPDISVVSTGDIGVEEANVEN